MNQKSNNIDMEPETLTFRSENKVARDKINEDIAAFVAQGNKIKRIKRGVSGDRVTGKARLH